eukprot:COSAG02_NODE_63531_length_263_cov_0.609756_1_plen_77_part_10
MGTAADGAQQAVLPEGVPPPKRTQLQHDDQLVNAMISIEHHEPTPEPEPEPELQADSRSATFTARHDLLRTMEALEA